MRVVLWWVADVPAWAWENIADGGHSLAGLGVFAVAAVLYAAVTLGVVGGVAALVAAFGRGVRSGVRDARSGK
ncbi:hypothetical protein [Streptomyces sp. G1]|uniref:hypothetical protein n=1 Tax=Streptomyces sp. G1 TaxID=361572 RepID=UPI00202F8070|nr:hypothetical protein [Streptomyces sp. G1]MCM1972328.1 hypothetical protein [Streptomyces sp. G1]